MELVISKNSLSRPSDLPTATQLSGVLSKAAKAVPYTLTAPMLGGLIANKNEIKQSIKDFEKKIALWDKKPISNEYAFLLFVLSKLPHESSKNQSFYVIEENGNYRIRFSGHNALARYLARNEQYKIGITFQSKDTPITFEPTFDVFYKEHVYYTEYLASDVLRDILQGIVDVLKGGFYNVPCDKELYSPNEKRYKEHFNLNDLGNITTEPKFKVGNFVTVYGGAKPYKVTMCSKKFENGKIVGYQYEIEQHSGKIDEIYLKIYTEPKQEQPTEPKYKVGDMFVAKVDLKYTKPNLHEIVKTKSEDVYVLNCNGQYNYTVSESDLESKYIKSKYRIDDILIMPDTQQEFIVEKISFANSEFWYDLPLLKREKNGEMSYESDVATHLSEKDLEIRGIVESGEYVVSHQYTPQNDTFKFAQELSTRYLAGEKYDWTHAQKLAKELKIEATNQELMQACELAVVLTARKLASENLSIAERFQSMRDLYDQQVSVKPLDTKGKTLQQYSTPCPLAFLLGEYVKNAKSDSNKYLEPSAGNGMLTIALTPENTIVNELDEIRVANLKTLGFERVTQGDARELPATPIYKGIITNPPFAIVDKPETRNSWTLNALDYILTAHALDSMADNGRAAIIVGGKMWGDYWKPLSERSEKKVLYGKWKWFMGYLYAQYNVKDVIYVDSHGIYNKQGTTYPIVIILIDGRHKYNEDNKPNYVFDTDRDVIINNYQQLFERIVPHIQPQPAQVDDDKSKRARALMLKMKMAKAI